MTRSTSVRELGTRRQPISVDRVTCWRLGPVVLDRWLEGVSGDSAAAHVVCADDDPQPEVEFAW